MGYLIPASTFFFYTIKKGIDKKNALKIAGFDGIADRANKRLQYHSQRSLKKMDLRNPNAFDEMEKGKKQSDRGYKLAQHSLDRNDKEVGMITYLLLYYPQSLYIFIHYQSVSIVKINKK